MSDLPFQSLDEQSKAVVLGRDLAHEVRPGRVLGEPTAVPEIGHDRDPLMRVSGPGRQRHVLSTTRAAA